MSRMYHFPKINLLWIMFMLFANEANVKPGHTNTKWNPTWIESRFLVSIVYFHNSPKPRSRVQARRKISKISGDKPMQRE